MISFSELGPRICIIGPSSSGKSTLATELARGLGVEAVHLDQLHHLPNTQWQPRPKAEFMALHEAAISGETWVIEGNYSGLMPSRFERATAVIWLDPPVWGCVWRYIRRTRQPHGMRAGMVEGAQDRFNWDMVRHILRHYPQNKSRYNALLKARNLPVVYISRMCELNRYRHHWGFPGRR